MRKTKTKSKCPRLRRGINALLKGVHPSLCDRSVMNSARRRKCRAATKNYLATLKDGLRMSNKGNCRGAERAIIRSMKHISEYIDSILK